MTTSLTLSGAVRLNGWLPIFPTLGSVWFVSSTNSNGRDDPGNGTRLETPFATIDYATGRAVAGDVIVVAPGHVENVATAGGLAFDVAGLQYIGLGVGSRRPTVNITATGARVTFSAANVAVRNFLFVGTIDAITNPILISAADVSLFDIETRDASATQAVDFIVTTAAADRLRISGWTHRGDAAAGADTALSIVGGAGITVEDFWIDGNFAVAAIENVTTACTNLTVVGASRPAFARTRNAADVIVTLVAASTANIGPNINARLQDNAANITEAFVGAAAQFFQPINIVNADGESSMQTNITASTDA